MKTSKIVPRESVQTLQGKKVARFAFLIIFVLVLITETTQALTGAVATKLVILAMTITSLLWLRLDLYLRPRQSPRMEVKRLWGPNQINATLYYRDSMGSSVAMGFTHYSEAVAELNRLDGARVLSFEQLCDLSPALGKFQRKEQWFHKRRSAVKRHTNGLLNAGAQDWGTTKKNS